jgi:hypothetical protein
LKGVGVNVSPSSYRLTIEYRIVIAFGSVDEKLKLGETTRYNKKIPGGIPLERKTLIVPAM